MSKNWGFHTVWRCTGRFARGGQTSAWLSPAGTPNRLFERALSTFAPLTAGALDFT